MKDYPITCKVSEINYHFGDGFDCPHILLRLKEIAFKDNNCSIDVGPMNIYMTKSRFSKLTDICWDGSEKDIERIKKEIVGKRLNLDIKLENS